MWFPGLLFFAGNKSADRSIRVGKAGIVIHVPNRVINAIHGENPLFLSSGTIGAHRFVSENNSGHKRIGTAFALS